MRNLAYKLLVSVLVAAAILSAPRTLTTSKISHESPLAISEPDALDLYIERLVFAESSGREDIVIIDTNGKKSYGCLQFQEETFHRFSEKYAIAGDIPDCPTQRQLARAILLRERSGWRHWFTSVTRIGKPPLHVRDLQEAG